MPSPSLVDSFARDNLPDHGNLLANLVRWAAHDNIPLTVDGDVDQLRFGVDRARNFLESGAGSGGVERPIAARDSENTL